MIKSRNKSTIAFLVIVILFITILPCLESYAQENNGQGQRLVKVGYFQDYATIIEPASEGNMGYGYDYLQEIAKYTGWKYEFIKCSWNEGIKLLEEGKIDIFGPMQKTEEREKVFDFPSLQMGLEYGVLFADKNRNILYEDLDFFDGMKVGTEKENYYTKIMEDYCSEKEIKVNFVYTDSKDIGAELKSGLYDTYITGDLQAIPNTTIVARLSFEPYYYATTKGNTQIVEGLNYALKNIFMNDKYFEHKLYDKYFSNRDISKPSLTNTAARAYDTSFSKMIKDNAWMMLGILTIFFAIVLIVIEASNRRLKTVLYIDSSTGKASLAKFKIDARALLNNAKPDEYILVSIDVNNFKYINDIYGYDAGNEVLKILAEHIEMILPSEVMLTARRSADNFVFITKTSNKQKILESMSDDGPLRKDVQGILGPDYNLTLSTGIYVIQQPLKNISVMLDYANIAKKTIKGRVGNPIAEYTPEMDKHMELKKKITVGMEAGLQHGEFITCMQPKYCLEDEVLIGAEVLVRWQHPDLGMLSPLLFIPLFEENGFIEKLDMYIFEATCKMIQKWKNSGVVTIPRISVNISRVTLKKNNLVKELKQITEKYQVKTNCLEIEITEGTLAHSTEKIICIINELKSVGFYVSIDDFGSGYSSLSILKDMPADIIKIDKEFLSETFDSQKGKKIINSIIKMSKELNLETVAEGIETKEQAESLKNMGCDVAQGFYFAKPMKPEDFEDMLIREK